MEPVYWTFVRCTLVHGGGGEFRPRVAASETSLERVLQKKTGAPRGAPVDLLLTGAPLEGGAPALGLGYSVSSTGTSGGQWTPDPETMSILRSLQS